MSEDELGVPQGVCLSPDGSLLHVNDSARRNPTVFEVAADGSLSNGRVILEGVGSGATGGPNLEGMKCDGYATVRVTGLVASGC